MCKPVWLVLFALVLAALACEFSFSTAKIESVKLAKDEDGDQETTTFSMDDTVFCVVEVKSAPDDTEIKAVWTAVGISGEAPDTLLGESILSSEHTNSVMSFALYPDPLLAPGDYKVDVYLDDELEATRTFTVQDSDEAVS
ncbi:MAG: hypothetical protein GYB65_22600 [Chloroflexi bacterium]|nr:hypothetical protein [Chloroflexota bacterium]